MKILILDYLSYSAHKNFNKIHIEALLKAGHSLHLVGKDKQFDNISPNHNVTLSKLPSFLTPDQNHTPLYLRIIYIICLLWARTMYRPAHYDCILIPTYDPMSIWVYRTSKRLLLITHDVHYLDNKCKYLMVKYLPSHYIYIGLSKEMSGRLTYLYPTRKVEYIPHGLCPVSLNIKRPSLLEKVSKYVICPINNKYNEDFVDALLSDKKLLSYLESNNIFLLAKKKLIKKKNHSNYVIPIGNDLSKPEYDYLIQNALSVILPYEYDYKYRCSGILFECVMRDTPVLAINIPAMSIYKNLINIKLFNNAVELIDGMEHFRTHSCKEVDKNVFDPYPYWLNVFDRKMKLTILISCMHQKDASIIEKSNVQSDVVIVNQCDTNSVEEFDFTNKAGTTCHAKFICTTERGLSRSRNMAIANAWGDICYMCDDDELLQDDCEEKILKAYETHPDQDIITFGLIRKNYTYPSSEQKMSIAQILRTSSVQTTFRREAIIDNGLQFDSKMGSGSGNGGGEENKFLMDCRRKGLKLYYVPDIIATVQTEDSQWFHGFTEKYFRDTFWGARRSLGAPLALIYLFYWCLIRSSHFDVKMSKLKMLEYSLKGYFEER